MSKYVRADRLEEIERQVRNLVKYAKESAVNVPDEVLEPYDGKPALRPHTIPGWWQVWSGGLCIALLTPDDVAPLSNSEDTEEKHG